MQNQKPVPGIGGDRYIPYADRTGEQSVVYFTRGLSAEGLRKLFRRVGGNMTGKVGIKLHTGEPHGPNIIPRPWVEALVEGELAGVFARTRGMNRVIVCDPPRKGMERSVTEAINSLTTL